MKILIIRLGSIGDVVLTTPVIAALKLSHPDADLDFLVKKEYHELLIGNPKLRRVIPFDGSGHKGLKGLLEVAGELRKEGYRYVIDLHGNLRSRVISALIPGSKTLRYDKQAVKRRLLLLGFKAHTKHTVDAYLSALAPLGAGDSFKIPLNPPFPKGETLSPSFEKRGEGRFLKSPTIYLSEEEERSAGSFLSELGIPEGSPLIGFNPGAGWRTKRWLEEGFIELGKRAVTELGAKVLIFGGPDEVELSERVSDGIGIDAFSVGGKIGLREAAALINRCSVFVTNDSGPMHIVTAVGTSVVAIFGPTVQGFGFSPLGKSAVVEKELRCRPCSLHGSDSCPKGHFECMKKINADEVFERVKGMAKP
ncbi:MAG: glycosyltransferase family 9 protein [Deltaproteobacteria bacterium]|nr:glycosyltransferase family 9 protein [Deltaproteobacteria bacterium]